MNEMLDNTNISIENYDAILKGWSSIQLKQNVTLGARGLSYCNSVLERQTLIMTYNWNIEDEGLDCSIASTVDSEYTLVTLYPNPTKDFLFINGIENPVNINIYNLLGKEVMSAMTSNKVAVKSLPNGVYLIRIKDGLKETIKKFIKN
ncbi:putative secreted protein (Por secretion system target) [Polaribacter sp. Hel1_33_96]|nr:putative secreted protein (Por secretion system target) [Polaribacter sp. Hel1_33_96]